MASEEQQLAKWGKIREGGLFRFVVLRGVLAWGLGTAILYSIFMSLTTSVSLTKILPISLMLFPLGGIVFGIAVWWLAERKYKQTASARDS